MLSQRRGKRLLCNLGDDLFQFSLSTQAGSRRPSILPVPDMFTSSSFSISGEEGLEGENNDESEDELDDPWRSPSEKIAWVDFGKISVFSLFSLPYVENRFLLLFTSFNSFVDYYEEQKSFSIIFVDTEKKKFLFSVEEREARLSIVLASARRLD